MAAKPSGNKSVLVIGLGRFGGSVAATLDQMGQVCSQWTRTRSLWPVGPRICPPFRPI